jgi:predicted alpha/beta-fold hydrolase
MAGAKKGLLLLAIGAAAGLLAAGCGGGKKSSSTTTSSGTTTAASSSGTSLSKSVYVTKMKAIGSSLSTSLNLLSSATTAATAATALEKVQVDLRAAAGRLNAITPPTAVATLHKKLAQAVTDFADELAPVITKLKAGKFTALSSVPSLKGLQEIQTASTAISNKGYKIGG